MSYFSSTSFYLDYFPFNKTEFSSGSFFPVSDACNKTLDPEGGCLYTPTYYFNAQVESLPIVRYSIRDQNHSIFYDESIKNVEIFILGKQDLRCATTKDCATACSIREGYWNNALMKCNITRYLSSVCYRLQLDEEGYHMDQSQLVDPNEIGCFYSNRWSPYSYSAQPSSLVTITVLIWDGCEF